MARSLAARVPLPSIFGCKVRSIQPSRPQAGASMSDKLIPVALDPLNAETPLSRISDAMTPTPLFYVRNHFPVPFIDQASFRLRVTGLVGRELSLSLPDLARLPQHSLTVTMECAGNGRKLMHPLPPGVTWNLGAVSTGLFGGVRLADVLAMAEISPRAIEVLCIGADMGMVEERGAIKYERSLSVAQATNRDVILATTLNNEPLTPDHGFPLRMIVPGWYGMAAVKWLTELRAIDRPFDGFYQVTHYVYRPGPSLEAEDRDGTPLSKAKPRSLITSVADSARFRVGQTVTLRGTAWSGFGLIRSVEFSDDGCKTWKCACLGSQPSVYAHTAFEVEWTPAGAGRCTLSVRATDAAGRRQPVEPVKDALGYGNNSVQKLNVEVTL